jgi:hypothetical protein
MCFLHWWHFARHLAVYLPRDPFVPAHDLRSCASTVHLLNKSRAQLSLWSISLVCGCWVTTSFTLSSAQPPLVIYKYSNALLGHTEEACLKFNWPEDNSNVTQSITFWCNMHFVHWDLPYMCKADNMLTCHQLFYRVPNLQNKLVITRCS